MGRAKGSKDAHKRARRKNTTKEMARMAAKKAKRHRKEAAALGLSKLPFKPVDAGIADGAPEVVTQ